MTRSISPENHRDRVAHRHNEAVNIDRRRLLVTAVIFAGSAEALRRGHLRAQTGPEPDDEVLLTMAQMARRLYPHDGLPDSVYAQILDDALSATAADPTFSDMLVEAEITLNRQQDTEFVELDAAGQIAALRAVEQTEFFANIQTAVRLRLYNHPAFWQLIGYEGPSWQFGGYLNRGAGEIDWLVQVQ